MHVAGDQEEEERRNQPHRATNTPPHHEKERGGDKKKGGRHNKDNILQWREPFFRFQQSTQVLTGNPELLAVLTDWVLKAMMQNDSMVIEIAA